MKIALLNDTHFGVRNDSQAFRDYQLKFYNEIFFPYLKENNINTLVHLGDVVDRRKFINFQTASIFRDQFWDRLYKEKIDTHIIIGNHDTYFKNTNDVNAIENLYSSFDKVNEPFIYTKSTVVEFDGTPILFVPWICDDNYDHSMNMLNTAKADLCFGHLEIKGIEMQNGVINEYGLAKSDFSRFEKVVSGHFHKHTDDGQIFYCGAQYEMTWSDYKDPKAFHVFDTETLKTTFYRNPFDTFHKLYYNDGVRLPEESELKGSFVKLIVEDKGDYAKFDYKVKQLQDMSLADLKIVEDLSVELENGSSVVEPEDTMTLLDNYIDEIDLKVDKSNVKHIMRSLYMEAIEL